MNTKHLINNLSSSVNDNLFGLVSINDFLQFTSELKAVVRKDYRNFIGSGKVLLISGGGAGHEPMFAGFVGSGLLTAAISGDIFASPPTKRTVNLVEKLISKESNNEILIIVANYTGDVLNFGLAREYLLLKGFKTEIFIFGEDVAFYGEGKRIGKRGLAGISLIHKLAGAMAEQGTSMSEIIDNLVQFSKMIGTLSISLNSCNIPGTGSSFSLASDEIELGLGIHGEAGVQRLKMCSAHQVVKVMLDNLIRNSFLESVLEKYQKRIVVLINNTGGLSQFELNIIIKETVNQLTELNFKIERIYSGFYMTSFGMSGVSISVMAVNNMILELLDRPAISSCWKQFENYPSILNKSVNLSDEQLVSDQTLNNDQSIDRLDFGQQLFLRSVELSCKALVSSEKYLNELDTESGDGDCGTTMSTASKYILKLIKDKKLEPSFYRLYLVLQENMGGTSGAIYSLMMIAASKAFKTYRHNIGLNSYDYINFWADVLKYCMNTISRYGMAKPGDRTMLDSMNSAFEELINCDHNLSYKEIAKLVAKSALKGAEITSTMFATVGRASYVNRKLITKPDPGAIAISIWMEAISQAFSDISE